MSAPQFTPGPWVVDGDGDVWSNGTDELVALCEAWEPPNSCCTVNARLIAASPELYDALAGILSAINVVNAIPGPKGQELCVKAEKALAKARGESLLAEQEDAK